jgi:hypothetical protein
VGTSYQTLLVVAEPTRVRADLAAAAVDGFVVAAGDGRTAVMPREGAWDIADTNALAALVSHRFGYAALSNRVVDSDYVLLDVYRDGRMVHSYVSDQSMLVDWFIDHDGTTKFRLNGVEYPADAPAPDGPLGADPAQLAPFGVGEVDLDRLGAALRGGNDTGEPVFAEAQHRAILTALNLDPRGLTTAFRHEAADLPGAIRVLPFDGSQAAT